MRSWCIGKPSAKYVAKREDVLSVYARAYDPKRPVVCVDEGAKELRGTARGSLPIEPGEPERRDYEYARHGTANLFVSVGPLSGRRRIRVTERRTWVDFAQGLRMLVDIDYAAAECVVLVCDTLSTHTAACLYEAFAPSEARRIAEKIEWHYRPEHGSWLNMADIALSVLHRQCLNRRLGDVPALEREVLAWQEARNVAEATIVWQFTSADARIKLRRLYPTLK